MSADQCLTGESFHLGLVFLLMLIVGAVLCRGLRAVANGRQRHDSVTHYIICCGFLPRVALSVFPINVSVGASCVVRTQTFGWLLASSRSLSVPHQ